MEKLKKLETLELCCVEVILPQFCTCHYDVPCEQQLQTSM
jgi:hypothetical protein